MWELVFRSDLEKRFWMRPRISIREFVRMSVRMSVTIKEKPGRDGSICPAGLVFHIKLTTVIDCLTDLIDKVRIAEKETKSTTM